MVIETNASKKKQIPLDFGTALLNNVIVTKPHNNRRGIMKNRKRGFSLVELLIVLAVIAALVATITPVAMNAIKKSKATQVAQNLKTLATALENSAYVNGVQGDKILNGEYTSVSIYDLGRDISSDYTMDYTLTTTTGKVTAIITYTKGDVDAKMVNEILPEATGSTGSPIHYDYEFSIY